MQRAEGYPSNNTFCWLTIVSNLKLLRRKQHAMAMQQTHYADLSRWLLAWSTDIKCHNIKSSADAMNWVYNVCCRFSPQH